MRREVAPLLSTEASLFRSEGREGREKEKRKRAVADAIGNLLLFKNEQILELLVPYPPYRGVCLKGSGRVSAVLV